MKEQFAIIRELAAQLAQAAAQPRYAENRRRWQAHNGLVEIQRPLLWICPDEDGGWLELVPEESLRTTHPDLRVLERQLRKLLYHHRHFADDFVLEPLVRFEMPGEYTGYAYGNASQTSAWGIPMQGQGVSKNAYHLNNHLDDPENIRRLLEHEVDFIPDTQRIRELQALYDEVVDGLVRIDFVLPYVVLVQSLLIELVHLRGLEQLMYDLYDEPELLHQILSHMAQSKVRLLDRLEQENRLFDNRTNIYTGSGGLGYLPDPVKDPAHIRLSDLWGFADSQEFSQVSPAMLREFALPYQAMGLTKFGMACYGCCEPLDDKYEMIFEFLPNIRRLSVSPWSNIEIAAENIGKKAIYSWKPNPALICSGFEEGEIRKLLRRVKDATAGRCFTEVILKDIRTCNPQALEDFVTLVRQELS